jgi:hypothetical protein
MVSWIDRCGAPASGLVIPAAHGRIGKRMVDHLVDGDASADQDAP